MNEELFRWAVNVRGIDRCQKLTLEVLAFKASAPDSFFGCSLEELSAEVMLRPRTLRKKLYDLDAAGLIDLQMKKAGHFLCRLRPGTPMADRS